MIYLNNLSSSGNKNTLNLDEKFPMESSSGNKISRKFVREFPVELILTELSNQVPKNGCFKAYRGQINILCMCILRAYAHRYNIIYNIKKVYEHTYVHTHLSLIIIKLEKNRGLCMLIVYT